MLAQPAPLQKIGKGEGQVDIVAWAGYIERGATDKAFDWVTDFEKTTGGKVNVKTAGTSYEMVALIPRLAQGRPHGSTGHISVGDDAPTQAPA